MTRRQRILGLTVGTLAVLVFTSVVDEASALVTVLALMVHETVVSRRWMGRDARCQEAQHLAAEDGVATDVALAQPASIDLTLLVPLPALLDERSVTRAAAEVGLSLPAMSHALRRLRRLPGDEHTVRQGSGMALTPRAVGPIAPLRAVLCQAARPVSPASFDPAVDRRAVTGAMTTGSVIGSATARLVAQHAPRAVLRLRTPDTTTAMASCAVFTEDGTDVVRLPRTCPRPFRASGSTRTGGWSSSATALPPATLPHVVFDGFPRLLRPCEILDEEGERYAVRDRVDDNLLVPHLVVGSGGAGLHRHRVATAMKDVLGLRIEEFSFPVPGPGIDRVRNPWLADERFRTWMRGILLEPAASMQRDGTSTVRRQRTWADGPWSRRSRTVRVRAGPKPYESVLSQSSNRVGGDRDVAPGQEAAVAQGGEGHRHPDDLPADSSTLVDRTRQVRHVANLGSGDDGLGVGR